MPKAPLLLIGNGEPLRTQTLKELARQACFVLAADGGANVAMQAGIVPDLVIGDLDSICTNNKRKLANKLLHLPTQENTDLEKSLSWIVQHKFTTVILVGFVGNRWDFSIGNLLTLANYTNQLDITVVTDTWRMYFITRNRQIACQPHRRASLIPLTRCEQVTLQGCKYPLVHTNLLPGTTRTLSNLTTSTRMRIRLARGLLLLYVENA